MATRADFRKASVSFHKELLSWKEPYDKAAQRLFINSANSFMDFVQGNYQALIPYYTGNLHDSIATVISKGGRIVRALYMPEQATRPQTAPGRKRIVGAEEAFASVRRQNYPTGGVYSTLIIGVPYAVGANLTSRKKGFVERFDDAFVSDMKHSAEALKTIRVYPGAKVPERDIRRFK